MPVVRSHMTGHARIDGKSVELDGIGYHDHNWGHFRDAVWDWGVVHLANDMTILYGRFASNARSSRTSHSCSLFDKDGPRPFS